MSDSRALLNIVLSVPGILGIAGIVFRARGAVLWRMAVLVVLVILLVLGGGLIREFAAEQDSHRIHAWTGMVFSGFWSQDFSFHFDLFSLGQGLFMSWASLTALLVDGKGWAAHRSKLSALLLFLSGVLGAVFAGNLLTFAAFSLVGLFPGVMVIGWDDSKNSAVSAVRFGAAGAAGTVLLLITYLGLHPVVAPVDIRLVGGFGIKDTLFWMFAVALLARAPIVPFHASQWTMLRLGRLPHLLPVMLAWNLGLYGLFRFGPMLFPDQIVRFSGALATLGGASLLAAALFVFRNKESRLFVHGMQVFLASAALMGFAALNRLGWMGAWMISWTGSLVFCAALPLLVVWERRGRDFFLADLARAPLYGGISAYTSTALACLPVSPLFFALVFSSVGASQAFRHMYLVVLAAVPLILAAAVRRLFFGHSNQGVGSPGAGEFGDLDRGERMALFPIVIFLILSLLFMNQISSRMSGVVGAALRAAGWGGE